MIYLFLSIIAYNIIYSINEEWRRGRDRRPGGKVGKGRKGDDGEGVGRVCESVERGIGESGAGQHRLLVVFKWKGRSGAICTHPRG